MMLTASDVSWHLGGRGDGRRIVRGASLVVWAIRDGRDVAERMHAFLKTKMSAAREKVAA